MKAQISRLLDVKPGLKGREIAKELKLPKRDVNSFLSKNLDLFSMDDFHQWFLINSKKLSIEFGCNCWLTSEVLETKLSEIPPISYKNCQEIELVFGSECKLLLEAAIRVLALCHELASRNTKVSLDFGRCISTHSYMDRIGFFEQLPNDVIVTPTVPKISSSERYKGDCETLMEFGIIDPLSPDQSLPKQLKKSFVYHAGEQYSQVAFTIISELFGNVIDHSQTPIPGMVALQTYSGKRPKIQTVISDFGLGIVETLRSVLDTDYPELAKKFCPSKPNSDPLLLKELFDKGNVTQTGEDGRGLGLKRSGDSTAKFNGTISIRQKTFDLKLSYQNGKINDVNYNLDLTEFAGSHICFSFYLD